MEEWRKAIFALTSRSHRAHVALTSPSNTPKSGERILGAHTALIPRSRRAQMGKITLLARHERIFWPSIGERDVIAMWARRERDVSAT